jgi:phospholipid-translocating ATPase
MIASMLLFENEFVNIVAIAFTATILNELVMVRNPIALCQQV